MHTETECVAWSCVLDDTPALWSDVFVWLATLTACAGAPSETIVVHHVTELRPDVRRIAELLNLRTAQIPRFDARSPHSNKITQCLTDFGAAQRIVLTDVDLAFLSRPPIEYIGAPIAGKLVDYPNPTIDILRELFRHARLPMPDATMASRADARGDALAFHTFPGNYNGGLYIVERTVIDDLGTRWGHWARWLLDNALIPARYAVHVDQISFCMAVHELGLPTETLDNAWNLPSHAPTLPNDAPPFAVHHHGRLDAGLRLLPLRPPRHETALARANAAIEAFLDRYGVHLD